MYNEDIPRYPHDVGLVDSGDLSSAAFDGVVEGVSSDSLGSLVGDEFDRLHDTVDDLLAGSAPSEF